ncbi:2-amino-4-hydroxy-6-hydroxymethyldihydropteridine diphosphokinase [Jeotgalicoccus coquinae]|uniref:2-amino-4-hydroxy-6-hydroxymethyldihydropteridine diphosphokinase n=1 Tax=Jeotgalicoccus coquinae TaxID=709509 RepID=A0A6V7RSA3_9STAP|nr:2-amino-4-hydroxy-6-hydroxymethyldihydropteridine diphosphokinase [Jeotgalicoccus coquinae]MBB6423841.1 2-amino-4-hydroxy-6-hydroxymethyldihydropteridine diphosphokinase [Jeotgalicoccus coquinae]GGE24584.1 2-amino-4-hydroxy-6-hydroxymethyldihydropteridine diphosphokinase [Jeotgalicoccus coquinae]CAD2080773.1 Bifunctional folate synthesis protein [Jeotgalicoccus coquinae]
MAIAYLGLGSNIGDREESLNNAIAELSGVPGIQVTKISSRYETKPYGNTNQPDFINMAVEVDTNLTPLDLLETVLGIEHELGRVRTEIWGPRSIDIDVLLYEDLELKLTDLKVPHPEMHLRSFVIDPLYEIAPKREHPTLHMTVEKIKEQLDKSQSAE